MMTAKGDVWVCPKQFYVIRPALYESYAGSSSAGR
jgi:hypothetical protein